MDPTVEQWAEWRARCALHRCGAASQAALRRFAWRRFLHYARVALRDWNPQERVPTPEACWHMLESELTVGRQRSGRRYKEWLFARLEGSADAPIDVIQGGATLLMRTVVRNWALAETRSVKTVSLDAPLCGGDSALTLGDLIPDADTPSPETGELDRMATGLTQAFFNTLDNRTRLVLLAKQLGLKLYDPRVLAAAQAGRSRISEIWRGAFIQLARRVREAYAGEPHDWQLALTLRAARLLGEKIILWGRAEKTAQPLFYMVEGRLSAVWPARPPERHG